MNTWQLGWGEIGVWISGLSHGEGLGQASMFLNDEELTRAKSFPEGIHRERFMKSRAFLRKTLAGLLNKVPQELRFEYGKLGKPRLACQQNPGGLQFNLSHSGDEVLLAAAWDLELGADLEHEQDGIAPLELAELACCAEEMAWLRQRPEEHLLGAFTQLWTLKEAVLKSQSLELAAGLKAFRVVPDEEGSATVLALGGPSAWRTFAFSPRPGLHAAIAYVHPGGREFRLAPMHGLDYSFSHAFEGAETNDAEICLYL